MWQPPFHKSDLTRDFYQRVKLRSRDVYLTLNEPFLTSSTGRRISFPCAKRNDDNTNPDTNTVAAICPIDGTAACIHFRDARCSWQVRTGSMETTMSTPCYRFSINDKKRDGLNRDRMVLQWEKRSKTNTGLGLLEAGKFYLFLIDRKARRKSRIATMTPAELEIVVCKSSILESLQACFDLTEPTIEPLFSAKMTDSREALQTWLYTQTLTLGAWVAYQEKWFS